MKSWIIVTGDEILSGKTLDYNSYWISKRLTGIGIEVTRKITVPDEENEIERAVQAAISQAGLIVTIGGLGPTPRDATLNAVAKALGKELTLNEDALKLIRQAYKRFYELDFVDSPEINAARKKMAKLPKGATPLKNELGGAPAVLTPYEDRYILSLPGIPSEMMYTLEKAIPVLPLQKKDAKIVRTREIYIKERDESVIAQTFEKVMNKVEGVEIKSYPSGFGKEMKMRVIAITRAENPSKAEGKLKKATSYLRELLREKKEAEEET